MLFLCYYVSKSHIRQAVGFLGWSMGTGERHIPMEWHVSSQDDAASLQADVGDTEEIKLPNHCL